MLREKVAEYLKVEERHVDIFAVQTISRSPLLTDVRFSAHGARYYSPVRLQALLLLNRLEVRHGLTTI